VKFPYALFGLENRGALILGYDENRPIKDQRFNNQKFVSHFYPLILDFLVCYHDRVFSRDITAIFVSRINTFKQNIATLLKKREISRVRKKVAEVVFA